MNSVRYCLELLMHANQTMTIAAVNLKRDKLLKRSFSPCFLPFELGEWSPRVCVCVWVCESRLDWVTARREGVLTHFAAAANCTENTSWLRLLETISIFHEANQGPDEGTSTFQAPHVQNDVVFTATFPVTSFSSLNSLLVVYWLGQPSVSRPILCWSR